MMPQKRIEDIGWPAVTSVPEDIACVLEQSMLDIVKMRQSVQSTELAIAQSLKAILETRELLQSLRGEGRLIKRSGR